MEGGWLAERLLVFIPLLLSLTVHEWAHAGAALWLGDDTARRLGRFTLDPLAHIDPVGTLVLPLLGVPFGWAKPVPVEPVRFHAGLDMRLGLVFVAAAGPLANVGLALVAAAGHALTLGVVRELFAQAVQLNVLLAFFNLLPIPPLDGSRLVDGLLPEALRPAWDAIQGLGMWLLVAVLVVPGLLGFDLFAGPRALGDALLGR